MVKFGFVASLGFCIGVSLLVIDVLNYGFCVFDYSLMIRDYIYCLVFLQEPLFNDLRNELCLICLSF